MGDKMKRRTYCKLLTAGAVGSVTLGGNTVASASGEVPLVSTRGHYEINFGFVSLTDGNTKTNYDTNGGVPGLDTEANPEELVVFLHGWNASPEKAITFTEETTTALEANGYDQPVVGYTWDSAADTVLQWWSVVEIALRNGAKLANFITDYKQANPGADVRLVPFSLGARVALKACELLAEQGQTDIVTTMSLLGAAVDDEGVDTGTDFAHGVKKATTRTDNFYNEDDPLLTKEYLIAEFSQALGAVGAEGSTTQNYTDHDVTYVDGHEEYFVKDVGAIPDVLDTW
jgi:esterase/lipase superfamily enzyme